MNVDIRVLMKCLCGFYLVFCDIHDREISFCKILTKFIKGFFSLLSWKKQSKKNPKNLKKFGIYFGALF